MRPWQRSVLVHPEFEGGREQRALGRGRKGRGGRRRRRRWEEKEEEKEEEMGEEGQGKDVQVIRENGREGGHT
jgi:hypothetical protein